MSKKFFRLKKPCKDCPFRKDSKEGWLGSDRAEEIAIDLESKSFSCHKTVDYSGDNNKNESFCAGAILVMENEYRLERKKIGHSLQLGERLGLYKKELMSGHDIVFYSFDAFICHHD